MNDEGEMIFSGGIVECERFIRWVRTSARNEGKTRDNDWMVDLTASALGGDALRWYAELDPAVSEDWTPLQRALLRRYAQPDSLPGHIIPAAPSAAPAAPAPVTGFRYGRLKIIGDFRAGLYISKVLGKKYGCVIGCNSPAGAMVVRYRPSDVPHAIEVVGEDLAMNWLGVQWGPHRKTVGKGCPGVVNIVLVTGPESPVIRSSRTGTPSSAYRKVWHVSELDGTIRVSWPGDGETSTLVQLAIFYESMLYFTGDYACSVDCPAYDATAKGRNPCEGRLIFDPHL